MTRLLHVNVVFGRRLKERHPKALSKITPLNGGHLAVSNEVALQHDESESQSTQSLAWAGDALRSSRAQSSSKQAAAADTRLVANKHNGYSVSILHAQNPVSEL
jgi:hypothetical protein